MLTTQLSPKLYLKKKKKWKKKLSSKFNSVGGPSKSTVDLASYGYGVGPRYFSYGPSGSSGIWTPGCSNWHVKHSLLCWLWSKMNTPRHVRSWDLTRLHHLHSCCSYVPELRRSGYTITFLSYVIILCKDFIC